MTKEQVVKMLNIVSEILSKEQNMLIVKEPVCVVGDIHGQYNDLINMMKKLGDPDAEKLNYLFLGDYVDRGEDGIEVCIFLFALKINFP